MEATILALIYLISFVSDAFLPDREDYLNIRGRVVSYRTREQFRTSDHVTLLLP